MKDNSYNNYRKYRANRHGYKVNQIAMPIAVIIIIALLTKFWWLLILIALSIVIIPIVNTIEKRKESTEITKVSTKKEMQKVRLNMSSTDIGYINKNNQKNNGRTYNPENDHQQWYYNMECLNCGHVYYSNGTDIWQRKCPKCQGGKSN